MKKLLALLLVGLLALTLVACGGGEEEVAPGTPIDVNQLHGRWVNGSGDNLARPFRGPTSHSLALEIVEFLEDGTVNFRFNHRDGSNIDESSIWQLNEAGTLLVSQGSEYIVTISGNILTIADVEGENSRQFQRGDGADEADEADEPVAATPFEVSELVGIWGNRSGDVLRSPFWGVSYPTIEFLEDNTLIVYNDRNEANTMVWQVTETGHLLVSNNEFDIAINGNILTITDDRGRVSTLQRIDAVPGVEGGGNDSASASGGDWRQFLADYDDWVTRFLRTPDDLSLIAEMVEWSGRAEQYTANLSANELVEFMQELTRIMDRML
ncbi:MAG: hypothetical protein FWD84_03365 [Oscillospiraceae bacterium]|nr:hypothetical protein [Oscillospiraceae bacterium]